MKVKLSPTPLNTLIVLGLAILVMVAGPLVILWSLNTLFPVLNIPYDIWSWLAVVVLGGVLKTRVSTK